MNPPLIKVNPREIVQTKIPRVTTSSVADLLACPKRFQNDRVSRDWGSEGPSDIVERGKALHGVMRELYTRRVDGDVPLDYLGAVVDRAIKKVHYSPDTDKNAERQRVTSMARSLVEADDYEDVDGTIGVEVSIEYDLKHNGRQMLKISSRLDRVLARASAPEVLVVRDYKSGKIRIDLIEAYIMLRTTKHKWPDYDRYQLEVDGFNEEDRVIRETVDYQECRDQHDYFRTRAVEVLTRGYDYGEWPACPGERCTYCRIRQDCQGLLADDIDNF